MGFHWLPRDPAFAALLGIQARHRAEAEERNALAAKDAGKESLTEVLENSTGLAIGYEDPLIVAKILDEYVKSTRSRLIVRSALMDGVIYNAAQVGALASLPSKEELLSRLLGQLQAPITQLASVLNGTIQGLAVVLQRRSEQLGS